jgi:hypothetical protein
MTPRSARVSETSRDLIGLGDKSLIVEVEDCAICRFCEAFGKTKKERWLSQ